MSDATKNGRFQALVMPHLDSAFNLACWLTRSRPDAEDLVQEACLRAFRFLDGFHGEDARAWLLTIVRNTFYTWYQERHAQPQNTQFDEEFHSLDMTSAIDTPERDNNPEKLLMRKDCERQLQRGLAALPLEFREVMVMRELEDLSYKQIAGIVGIPIGTVMSRLGRGRKLLARILAPGNQEE
ncbi:sigma-70 family RNA polymerase sigma factor [Herbaspirillum sp.]|uniref:sigma-70 family RNA polymerase sigma factor n=1 Tax=Herbaspirillum sp. TaxID=1890675 RepID=UPI0031DFD93D